MNSIHLNAFLNLSRDFKETASITDINFRKSTYQMDLTLQLLHHCIEVGGSKIVNVCPKGKAQVSLVARLFLT